MSDLTDVDWMIIEKVREAHTDTLCKTGLDCRHVTMPYGLRPGKSWCGWLAALRGDGFTVSFSPGLDCGILMSVSVAG